VVACLEAWIAQKTAETAEKAEEARLATELTAAVLAERRVRHSEHSEFCHGCEDVDYTLLYAHWPHPHDDKIVSSEDAVAWEAELQAARVETRDAARKEADQRVKAIEEAKRARLAPMLAWAEEHGSARLKACIAEQIECRATYRDERLSLERPGWRWSDNLDGEHRKPRNPPAEAFDLLANARELEADATLVYWMVDQDEENDDYRYPDEDDDRPKYCWTGYAAVANFLDQDIVFGGPPED
jgi:hypothetical protein